jgi:hypothetical protein
MNDYTVALTNGIEICVKGNNEAEALQDAKLQATEINQSVLGDGNIQKLDCSISF